MSTNNNSGQRNGEDPCAKDRDILCECKTAMINEVELLGGVAKASKTTKEGQEETRDNKVCCVLKAEETSKVYQNIDYYVAIDANCKTEQIEKNVGDLIKKSGKLGDAIKDVVNCLKGIKAKAVELKAKACDLDTQIKDECNRTQLDILDRFFDEKCQVNKPDGGCFDNFSDIAGYLGSQTNKIYDKANKTFNDAVSVSGIHTFSCVDSLKDLSKTTAVCVKDFKKNIDDNVKSSTDELKKAHEELAKCIKEVSTKTLEEHRHTTVYEGTAFTLEFVCCDCEPDCRRKVPPIDEICCKVMQTLCNDIECPEDDDRGGKPNYPYQDKNYD